MKTGAELAAKWCAIATEATRRADRAEAPYLKTCPWCGADQRTAKPVRQIDHLIGCGDRKIDEARTARYRAEGILRGLEAWVRSEYGQACAKARDVHCQPLGEVLARLADLRAQAGAQEVDRG